MRNNNNSNNYKALTEFKHTYVSVKLVYVCNFNTNLINVVIGIIRCRLKHAKSAGL